MEFASQLPIFVFEKHEIFSHKHIRSCDEIPTYVQSEPFGGVGFAITLETFMWFYSFFCVHTLLPSSYSESLLPFLSALPVCTLEFLFFFFFFFFQYLFIWQHQVLVLVVACGSFNLSCSVQGLVPWVGIEPRPCVGRAESQPLDSQGRPRTF